MTDIDHEDHIHHELGTISTTTVYPVLTVTEYPIDVDDPDDHEILYALDFHGNTLLHVAEAYRLLGTWLDERYAGSEATA